MVQFAVNPLRFDPYKNFKFRVKWDGRYVAGISKVSALKRTTEVVEHREGGDPSTSRKSPGRTKYEAITLERGVTHDTEFESWANKVWNFGSGLGAEVSLKDFRKDVIIDMYNEAGQLVISYKVYRALGLGVPGAAGPRRERERRRDPAHQARERGLRARRRGRRAGRAAVLGAVAISETAELSAAATLELWDAARALPPAERPVVLARADGATVEEVARLPIGRRDARLLGVHAALGGAALEATAACPHCGAAAEFALDVDSLLARADEAHEPRALAFEWRSPDSRDLAAASVAPDAAEAERVLLERCVGVVEPTEEQRRAVTAAMAEADPLAEVLVDMDCPACGEPFVADVDIAQFVWSEVRARALGLLRDVDALARAYGWTEEQVLALGDARRGAYLELVEGAA